MDDRDAKVDRAAAVEKVPQAAKTALKLVQRPTGLAYVFGAVHVVFNDDGPSRSIQICVRAAVEEAKAEAAFDAIPAAASGPIATTRANLKTDWICDTHLGRGP